MLHNRMIRRKPGSFITFANCTRRSKQSGARSKPRYHHPPEVARPPLPSAPDRRFPFGGSEVRRDPESERLLCRRMNQILRDRKTFQLQLIDGRGIKTAEFR